MKIGIVGKGFVGSAVQNGFSPNNGCDAEVRDYDKIHLSLCILWKRR